MVPVLWAWYSCSGRPVGGSGGIGGGGGIEKTDDCDDMRCSNPQKIGYVSLVLPPLVTFSTHPY